MQLNFISSDKVFANVNTVLSSFGNAGLLDEETFYPMVKSVLIRLNIPAFEELETVIDVVNYKATLPDDFYMLWALWKGCKTNETKTQTKLQHQYSYPFLYEDTIFDYKKLDCKTVITPTDNNIVRRDVYFQEELVYSDSYNDVQLLKLKKGKQFCNTQCPNKNTNNHLEFNISEKQIHTNFQEGTCILQYYSFPKDEYGLPLIPDNVHIEEAIEAYIIFKSLQQMYYNNTADVFQRMQYAEIQFQQKFKQASDYLNLTPYSKMIEMYQKNSGKWSKYFANTLPRNQSWFYPYINARTSNTFKGYRQR